MATYTKPSEIKNRQKRQRIASIISLHGIVGRLKKLPAYIRTPRGLLTVATALLAVALVVGGIVMYNDSQNRKQQQAQEQNEKKQKYGELTQAARATLVSGYLAEQKYEEAHDAVVFANDPESKDNLLLLALVYESQQQYDKALEVLERAKSLHGTDEILTEYQKALEMNKEGSDGSE